jgi:hypothetical protein
VPDPADAHPDARKLSLASELVGLRWPPRREGALTPVGLSHGESPPRVEIPLAEGEGALSVVIQPRVEEEPAFRRTPNLNLSYRGDAPGPLLDNLFDALTRRLHGASFDALLTAVRRVVPWPSDATPDGGAEDARGDASGDPMSQGEGGSGGRALQRSRDRWRGVHETWADPDQWRRFFAVNEIKRARDTVMQIEVPSIHIEHGEFECQFVGIGDFVDYPWRSPWERGEHNRHLHPPEARGGRPPGPKADGGGDGAPVDADGPRDEGSPRDDRQRDEAIRAGAFVSDMDDLDVVDGGQEKLGALLTALQGRADPSLVSINCTCVPMMIGDPIDDLVTEFRARVDFPVVYRDQGDGSPYGPNMDALAARLAAAAPPPDELDRRAVNLVGFRDGRGLDELVQHLTRLGVRLNRRIVPRVVPEDMDDYRRAAAQVIQPNADWDAMLTWLLGDLEMSTLRPEPPYGLARSLSWLGEVVAALDEVADPEAYLSGLRAALRPAWEERVAHAGAVGVGLILDPLDVPAVLDAAQGFSLPLLSALDEMGFQLRLALYEQEGWPVDAEEERLREAVSSEERLHLTRFTTPEDLDAWLASPALQLVYSDYRYDHRLTRAGKTPFSSQVFELGAEGALRALDRLLALGRLPLYRRWGALLHDGEGA